MTERRQRQVLITELDKRYQRRSLEDLLQARGIDISKPYRKVEQPLQEGDLYVQDLEDGEVE